MILGRTNSQDLHRCLHQRISGLSRSPHNSLSGGLPEDWKTDVQPWQQELLLKYLETFGEVGEDGKRFVNFYGWW